jgi:two-component system, LytTR family, sensor kinase
MLNPILNDRKVLLSYWGIWLLVIIFHAFLLFLTNHILPLVAITDAAISNLLFGVMGIGLWFPFFYSKPENGKAINTIVNHLIVCIVTVGFWVGATYFLLITIYSADQPYINFMRMSIPWRVGIGILFYEVIVLVYYLFILIQKNKERLLKEAELKALIKESELSALKSQINPHFIFNSLNSISSLTIIEPSKAREMIIKLSDFLRYSISNKEEKLTSLEEELNNLNRYLDIEKIRFGKRMTVKQNIEPACRHLKLPGLILQPLVENAVKYGIYENTGESVIELSAFCNSELLSIALTNFYDPDFQAKKGEGIGLKNIRSRLHIIYNNDDLLHVAKSQDKFEVTVIFPQQY